MGRLFREETLLAEGLMALYLAWANEVVGPARRVLGDCMEGLLVFGSVGRGTPRDGSDLDILVVASGLPMGRGPRARLAEEIENLWTSGRRSQPDLTLILRTPEDVVAGFPLIFDMVDDGRIPFDPNGTVKNLLLGWRRRLEKAGARRIQTEEGWYWDLSGGRKDWEL